MVDAQMLAMAQLVSAAATTAGVATALIAGVVAVFQLRTQAQSHAEREYSETFASYLRERDQLRAFTTKLDFDEDKPEVFDDLKFILARNMRLISSLERLERRAGPMVSRVDFIFLSDDIDFIEYLVHNVASLAALSFANRMIQMARASATRSSDVQRLQLIGTFEQELLRIGQSDAHNQEKALRVTTLVTKNMKILDAENAGVDESQSPEEFLSRLRRMRQAQHLGMLVSEFAPLNLRIHRRTGRLSN